MLPLCEALDISVNELLSGEKLSIINYQEKAEDNMLSLLKENEANRKRLFQTIVSIVTTIIASVSLIMMASFLNLNTIIRIFLISIALIIIDVYKRQYLRDLVLLQKLFLMILIV